MHINAAIVLLREIITIIIPIKVVKYLSNVTNITIILIQRATDSLLTFSTAS